MTHLKLVRLLDMLPMQKVQYIKDPSKPFTTSQLRRDKLNLWIAKMTKTLKESANSAASSAWLAPILIGLLFSYNVYSSRLADDKQIQQAIILAQIQKDILVLQTQKNDEDKQRIQDRQREEQNQQMDRAWRENMNKGFARLELIVQGRYPQQNQLP